MGIAELNDQQEKELRRTYEEPLLVKLELSRKLSKSVLHNRTSVLRLGRMTPRTTIDTLTETLHLENVRKQGVTSNATTVQKEYLQVETDKETQIGCDPSERCWNRTHVDENSDFFFTRGIEIKHNGKDSKKMSQNKTIMEHALQYTEQINQNRNILKQINFVRLKKRIFLPCELVGNNGQSPTDFHRDA